MDSFGLRFYKYFESNSAENLISAVAAVVRIWRAISAEWEQQQRSTGGN